MIWRLIDHILLDIGMTLLFQYFYPENTVRNIILGSIIGEGLPFYLLPE